jgi:hypothetical protein
MNFIPIEFQSSLSQLFDTIVDSLQTFLAQHDVEMGGPALHTLFSDAMTSFLRRYIGFIEDEDHFERLSQLLRWMLLAPDLGDETSSFPYWHSLVQRCVSEGIEPGSLPFRFYFPVISDLRQILIRRIPSYFESADYEKVEGYERFNLMVYFRL